VGERRIHRLLHKKGKKLASLAWNMLLKVKRARELENAIHILLKCSETYKWRNQFLSAEWLKISEEMAYKRRVSCNNVSKLRYLGIYLYRVRCRWEKEGRNQQQRMETMGGGS
jgi:hypothetical protein